MTKEYYQPMATKQSTIDYLFDQLGARAGVTYRKMFGEYAIYFQGKVVALVCDDELYIKPTVAGAKLIPEKEQKSPYKGAKPYYWISGEKWEDGEWLCSLLLATASELPAAKKKRKL